MRWLLLLALLCAGCGGEPEAAIPEPVADWTVMFYVAADNDLEDAEMTDLLEILAAGSHPGVQLTALVDRSGQGSEVDGYSSWQIPGQGDWTGARWLSLVGGQAKLIADQGSQNMADGEVLGRFLHDAVARYPARHYALFIADHGEAWHGICADDGAADDDLLDPLELSRALQQGGFDAAHKLDLLAFDACLMGSLEVATSLERQVRFLVASEETVPWSGFCYRRPLELLGERPHATGLALGRWLIDAYRDTFAHTLNDADKKDGELATLSLLDLSRVRPVDESVERLRRQLLATLQESPSSWLQLARIRAQTEEFGQSERPTETGANERDLGQLAGLLAELPGCRTICQELRQRLNGLVLDSFAGKKRPHATGLAIFFPPDQEAAAGYTFASWSPFISRYVALERQDRSRPELGQVSTDGHVVNGETAVSLRSRLGRPEGVDEAWLVVAQDGWILGRQPSPPDDGSSYLEDVFDHSWLTFSLPGQGSRLGSIQQLEQKTSGGDLYQAQIPAQWRRSRGRWEDVTLAVLLDFGKDDWPGSLKAVTRTAGSLRRQITPRPGDELRLPRERIRDGAVEYGTPLRYGRNLHIALADVPAGHYDVGFAILTYTGQRACRTVPVQVE